MYILVTPGAENKARATVVIQPIIAKLMKKDASYRCMVYCTKMEPTTGLGSGDGSTDNVSMVFPRMAALSVNNTDVPIADFSGGPLEEEEGGLAGCTLPVNITDLIIKEDRHINHIHLKYGFTQMVSSDKQMDIYKYAAFL